VCINLYQQPPKPKRKRTKKLKEVITVTGGAASSSTPKPMKKRAKKNKEVITEVVPTSLSTPLRLQQAPSSPLDLNYSPGALTRR